MTEGAKTLTFAGVAAGLLLVAVFTQPRAPQGGPAVQAGDILNEVENPLSATRLGIIQFAQDTASVKDFEVARIDGVWVIPSHQNYPADADQQMAEAATSVMNLKILGVVTNNPGDHATYGVVDPDIEKLKPGTTGVGMRVTMQDEANKKLVNMVIGKEVKDQSGQRYVREVGRDRVCVVKLDPNKLTTRFEDWIEDDLLKLNSWDITDVTLKDYSVELSLAAGGLSILWDQRSEMTLSYSDSDSKWSAKELKVFDQQKRQFETVTLADDEEVNKDKLNDLKSALDDLKIVDVERKPEGLSEDLKAEKDFAADREAVQNLAARGFMPVQITQDSFDILSTDGEVLCRMKDGVQYLLRFGKLVLGAETTPADSEAKKPPAAANESDPGSNAAAPEQDSADAGTGTSGVNRYIFVTARFNDDAIEQPKLEELPELPDKSATEAAAAADQQPDQDSAQDANAKATDEKAPPAATPAQAAPESGAADPGATGQPAAEEKPPAANQDQNQAQTKTEDASQPNANDKKETLEDLIKRRKEIEQENQKKLDEYKDKVEKGKERVKELNGRFGDWYYVISDSVFKKIHLGRDDVIKKKEKEEEKKDEAATGATPDSG